MYRKKKSWLFGKQFQWKSCLYLLEWDASTSAQENFSNRVDVDDMEDLNELDMPMCVLGVLCRLLCESMRDSIKLNNIKEENHMK